jgi:hypothetical protein
MKRIFTIKDIAELSWHDSSLYGISWQVDSDKSDLILDIDYICEWVCNKDKSCSFRVAPATLIFHDTTDLKINIDEGGSGFQVCVEGGKAIDDIAREQVKEQKICLDRPYYKWFIKFTLTYNKDSFISFGASDFTLSLRKEPVLTNEQSLPLNEREK